jgi:ESS family glutamate:Na+ symporter
MFNFWDSEVWSFLLTLAILLAAMLLANLMRRYIPFLRKLMIPSALLGGFLVLIADVIYKSIAGVSMFNDLTLEYMTYHGLGLGFVALALKSSGDKKEKKKRNGEIMDSGLSVVGSYLIQGIVGLAVTLGLSVVIANIFPASGLILPMGYGQGPGQAFNWGQIYENLGFANGASFGLTIAAMGFITASIGGCVYFAGMRKRGKLVVGGSHENAEDCKDESVSPKDEIPMSESMDKMTVQIAFVVISYIIAFGIMYGLYRLFLAIDPDPTKFLLKTVNPLIWGFNFLVGTAVAMGVKAILNALYRKGVMKRKYTNDFMLSRIGGFCFDFMVVASIAAIKLEAFTYPEFIIPLSILCIAGGVVTYFYLKKVSKKVFPNYPDEQFLALFGNCTGTASTGVILAREVDPEFRTPAASNLVYLPLYAIVFGFPMLLLLGVAPDPIGGNPNGMAWLTLGILIVLFVVINLILFRKSIFHKAYKQDKKEE